MITLAHVIVGESVSIPSVKVLAVAPRALVDEEEAFLGVLGRIDVAKLGIEELGHHTNVQVTVVTLYTCVVVVPVPAHALRAAGVILIKVNAWTAARSLAARPQLSQEGLPITAGIAVMELVVDLRGKSDDEKVEILVARWGVLGGAVTAIAERALPNV